MSLEFKVDYTLLVAMVLVTVPTLLLFFIDQKQFVRTIANSGLK